MDHERAFFQAIREAPHDDAPRLIYADWLDEQGGAARTARAAFIRIQCHLAALSADDSLRQDLEDEAGQLLAEHESEWTAPLHGLVADWQFSRGFVERVTIGAEKFLSHAERLFAFAPLRALHLIMHPRDVPHLAACEQLRWLETLDFSGSHLNDRALQQLLTSPYLDRLTALCLKGNGINTPGIRALVAAPLFAQLRQLDLSRNMAIGDTAVRLLAKDNPAGSLEVLNLEGTNVNIHAIHELLCSSSLARLADLNVAATTGGSSFGAAPLEGLPASLRSLNLSHVHLSRIRPLLQHAGKATNLQALYLADVNGSDLAAEWLAQASSLANLTLLDLSGNNLGATGARTLAESPHLASLTHLDLSRNNLRDSGAKALAESPHFGNLRTLKIRGNGIGGPGLKALAASANLDRLRTLDLACNFIGVESVRALAESPHLRQLTWLDLSDAFLEEDSAGVLASSPNLATLRTLLVRKNLLGDRGVKALAQSPHLARLTALDLNDNRIGKAGAEALAAASAWRQLRSLDLRGNVFTDTQEALLRQRFGAAVQL